MKLTKYTFNNPFEMAIWIKQHTSDTLRQEQLMYEGVQSKHINGIYALYV